MTDNSHAKVLAGLKQIIPAACRVVGRQIGPITISLARRGGLLPAIRKSSSGRIYADLSELSNQLEALEDRELLSPSALHAMLSARVARRAATARWRASRASECGGVL